MATGRTKTAPARSPPYHPGLADGGRKASFLGRDGGRNEACFVSLRSRLIRTSICAIRAPKGKPLMTREACFRCKVKAPGRFSMLNFSPSRLGSNETCLANPDLRLPTHVSACAAPTAGRLCPRAICRHVGITAHFRPYPDMSGCCHAVHSPAPAGLFFRPLTAQRGPLVRVSGCAARVGAQTAHGAVRASVSHLLA